MKTIFGKSKILEADGLFTVAKTQGAKITFGLQKFSRFISWSFNLSPC